MLRQVYIFKGKDCIYKQRFGKALDEKEFENVLATIEKDAKKKPAVDEPNSFDFYKYRISYLMEPSKDLIFLFVSDLTDRRENIARELKRVKKEFLSLFADILDHNIDTKTFEIFNPTIETVHKNLRPKISLVGYSGVGKTTITRLIRAEEIPTEHIPTMNGEVATIKIGNLHFHLWDFAGQEQFSYLWNNFVKGSDAVLIITDSTLENVEKSRFFLELVNKEAPYAKIAVIGNKQDLPDALPIPDIERILGVKAYSMVATDPDNRDKMITIIADVLEMSAEVSPLLAPLIERDKKMAEAEKALENNDFRRAMELFEEVADLCIKLGEDKVSQELHEKAEKIRKVLEQLGEDVGTAPAAPEKKEEQKEEVAAAATTDGTTASETAEPSSASQPAPPRPKVKPVSPPPPPAAPKLNIQTLPPPPDPQTATPPPAPPTPPATPKTEDTATQTTATPAATAKSPKEVIENQIIELKVKLSNINTIMTDLEMKNIMGELSDEEYNSKIERLQKAEEKLKKQIEELEKLKNEK